MITINIKENEILIKGHAEYDVHGSDIVCASVSSIVMTSINNIIAIDNKAIKYIENDGLIKIEKLNDNECAKKILDNLVRMLEELRVQYPKNIKIEKRN